MRIGSLRKCRLFSDHEVVYYGGVLYDPSYGVKYELDPKKPPEKDEKRKKQLLVNAFEAASIQGYGFLSLAKAGDPLYLYARKFDANSPGLHMLEKKV
jgi:hypothetical protein